MKKIKIAEKEYYYYNEIPLYLGRKKIDKEIARENLKLLKKLLDGNNLQFGIIFGTLLGAVREKDFISHDEDTDIFIFEEDKKKLLTLLREIEKLGFEVARYDNDRGELSIIRNNEYIDIYILKKQKNKLRCCNFELNRYFFETFDKIEFIGEVFLTPKEYEKWLCEWYGEDWKIPKFRNLSKNQILKAKLMSYLKKISPGFMKKMFYKIKTIKTNEIVN
ncbi:MAG: LicD family protein [Cetobacterium sp.]